MTERSSADRPAGRGRLTRVHVLQAALNYVDNHGLEALSMHKLGVQLGVRGMSLYSHVASKDALLDGMVEVMWAELESPATTSMTWPDAIRSYAHSLRDMILRHPAAAPLLNRALPTRSLEYLDAYRQVLLRDGFTDHRAIQALRVVYVYASGFGLAEVAWCESAAEQRVLDDLAVLRRVADLVPRNIPDHLLRLAVEFCTGSYQTAGQIDHLRSRLDLFQSGLDLMVKGMEGWK